MSATRRRRNTSNNGIARYLMDFVDGFDFHPMHWFSNCVLANLHNEQIVWFQMSLRKEWKEQGEEIGSIN